MWQQNQQFSAACEISAVTRQNAEQQPNHRMQNTSFCRSNQGAVGLIWAPWKQSLHFAAFREMSQRNCRSAFRDTLGPANGAQPEFDGLQAFWVSGKLRGGACFQSIDTGALAGPL